MKTSEINVSLAGFNVGLSGAVPLRADWTETAQDRAILEFVALLSGMVLKYGGRVVHGSHPTFTPVVLRQAELHANLRAHPRPIELVMSNLWGADLDAFDRDRYQRNTEFTLVPQVGDGGKEDPKTRNASLSAMRRVLVQKMNLLVAVGGMTHAGSALVAGVEEEIGLARRRGLPCFVVGGLGGKASEIAIRYGHDASGLNNGLTDEANRALLFSKDVASCVSIIFEHLARNPQLAKRTLSDLD